MKDGKYKTEELDKEGSHCTGCVDYHLKHEHPEVRTNCDGCVVYVEDGVMSPPTQNRMKRPGWYLDYSLQREL